MQSGKRNGADGCLLCSTDAIHPTARRPCVGWKQPAAPVPDGRLVLHGTSFIIAACGWIRRPLARLKASRRPRLWVSLFSLASDVLEGRDAGRVRITGLNFS